MTIRRRRRRRKVIRITFWLAPLPRSLWTAGPPCPRCFRDKRPRYLAYVPLAFCELVLFPLDSASVFALVLVLLSIAIAVRSSSNTTAI